MSLPTRRCVALAAVLTFFSLLGVTRSARAQASPLGDPPPPIAADATKVPAAAEAKPEKRDPVGWNGDHFYIQSSDGSFSLQPYGWVQTDYRAYWGNGVPANTFLIRSATFGFQIKYDKYYEFRVLAEFADGNSTLVRDFFINLNYLPEFQVQIGQFIEPFGQEGFSTSVQYINFTERGLTALLYPSAPTFRSPGLMLHGDLIGGTVSYWAGLFNGKGPLAANTTSEPEFVGRLRVYPFKSGGPDFARGLAFGASYGHGRSRGLSNELSFSTLVPDRSVGLTNQTPINGPLDRFNADFTWVVGPAALRAEYDQLHQTRHALDAGYANLPQVEGKAFTLDFTLLLTGERRPENGQPKPLSPFLTNGKLGFGAWELKGRFSYLKVNAPGDPSFFVPDIQNSVDEWSFGLNWYPSPLVRYTSEVNVYKILDYATQGGQPPQSFVSFTQRIQFRF